MLGAQLGERPDDIGPAILGQRPRNDFQSLSDSPIRTLLHALSSGRMRAVKIVIYSFGLAASCGEFFQLSKK